ncbi:MAG: glycerol-3-phosphate ABC transporter ATP-binding protein [Planctomycetaceae bacterium]|nr:glycerol-3-phosphate ABC transporter ATP-binding protein [Planctomycetaceae bacterium]
MSEVKLQNVSKIYPGNIQAVSQVDFTAQDSEFIVLLGPSGCGKSTILRMIAGLEDTTAGTILIGGQVVNKIAPRDRDVAMVFQNHALYPHMTVYKNLAFSLRLRKYERQKIDEKVRRAADILGLCELLDRKPGTLSGGEQQRVALGRAMVREPAVFLLDEPLSNLAAHLRLELRAELNRMHHRLQTTTIYVTHDQEEAMTLADRVVVMSAGRVQQCGTPLDIYHSPANRFVAGFLGVPPMNAIDGILEGLDGDLFFVGRGLRVLVRHQHTDFLTDTIGQNVVLGLRPEGVLLKPPGEVPTGESGIECRVDVVEPLGGAMNVFLHANDACPLVARVEPQPVTSGSNVKVWFDPNSMHFFSPGPFGENLAFRDRRQSVLSELPTVSSSGRDPES